MPSSKINFVLGLVIALLLVSGATYALAANTWTPPPGNPPTCDSSVPGCNVPINVSGTAQIKDGGFVANLLQSLTSLFVGADLSGEDNDIRGKLYVYGGKPSDPSPANDSGGLLRLYLNDGNDSAALDYFNFTTKGDDLWIGPQTNTGTFVINELGNVGIGATPTAKLDVNGNVRIRGTVAPAVGQVLTTTNTSGDATWQTPTGGTGLPTALEDNLLVGSTANGWQQKLLPSNCDGSSNALVYDSTVNSFGCNTVTGGPGGDTFWGGSLTGNINNLNSGNVGIGTASPTTKLDVVGAGINLTHSSAPAFTLDNTSNLPESHINFKNNNILSWRLMNTASDNFMLKRYGSAGAIQDYPLFVDSSTGDVALGRVNGTSESIDPLGKLEVIGNLTINGGQLIIPFSAVPGKVQYLTSFGNGVASWTDGALPVGSGGQTLYFDRNAGTWTPSSNIYNSDINGNVGIGTDTPVSKLQVSGGDLTIDNNKFIHFLASGATAQDGVGIRRGGGGALRAEYKSAFIFKSLDNASVRIEDSSGTNAFQFNPGGNSFLNGGKVGIKTITPVADLHVEGTVRIADGTEADGYVLTSDAEGDATWQPGGGGVPPATPGNINQTLRSGGAAGWLANSILRVFDLDNPGSKDNVLTVNDIIETANTPDSVAIDAKLVASSTETDSLAVFGPISANSLNILNNTKTGSLQVTTDGTEIANHVLTSDALGNATWQDPGTNPNNPLVTLVSSPVGTTIDYLTLTGQVLTKKLIDLGLSTHVTGTLGVANGGTNLTSAPDDGVIVGNGTTWKSKTLPDCRGDGQALTYDALAVSPNGFGCNTITTGEMIDPGSIDNTLRWDGTKWAANNTITNNGTNVGIGTITPAEKLHVNGIVKIEGNAAGAASVLKLQEGGASDIWWAVSDNNSFSIRKNNDPTIGYPIAIGLDQDVGIGRTSSGITTGYKLDVSGATLVGGLRSSTDIIADGNVGIGTATPTEKLDVMGKTKTGSLQVTTDGTEIANLVLTSDALGNATWQNPGTNPNNPGITDGTTEGQTLRWNDLLSKWEANDTLKVISAGNIVVNGTGNFTGNLIADSNAYLALASLDKVGIGTGAPTAKLNSLSTTEQLRLSNTPTQFSKFTVNSTSGLTLTPAVNSSTAYNFTKADGTTSVLDIDATNARVGIGTTAPAAKLHVVSATAGAVRIVDGTQAAGRVLTSDANGIGMWAPSSGSNWTISNTNDLHNTLNGNVGIGMTPPTIGAFKLEVNGSTFTDTLGVGSNTLFANSAGNVGIGTASPAFKLQVAGNDVLLKETSGNSLHLRVDGNDSFINNMDGFVTNGSSGNGLLAITGQGGISLKYGNAGSSGTEALRIDGTGKVGIGDTTPSATLDITGTMALRGNGAGDGKVLTSDADGDATWVTAGGGKPIMTLYHSIYAPNMGTHDICSIQSYGADDNAHYCTVRNDDPDWGATYFPRILNGKKSWSFVIDDAACVAVCMDWD